MTENPILLTLIQYRLDLSMEALVDASELLENAETFLAAIQSHLRNKG